MKKLFSFKKPKEGELRNAFSKYVPADIFDSIMAGKLNAIELPFKKGSINFIIIQLKEEPIEELQNLHKEVVSTILENNGFVVSIISTIVLATFGFPFQDDKNAAGLCEHTGYSLLKSLGDQIKVIYGSDEGFYGNIGTSKYSNYGPLIPRFNNKLSFLMNLEYGKLMKI